MAGPATISSPARKATTPISYGRGYGRDVIIDNAIPGLFDPPQHDKLQFIDEIRWTDLDFLRDGPTDTLRMRVKGTTDEVILQDFLETVPILGFLNLIEDIVFGDGTTWTGFKLAQHYIDIAKTAGNDTIYGYEELSDFIDGGAGDDRLIGFGGNDVYQFALGEGNDTILDSRATTSSSSPASPRPTSTSPAPRST